MAAPLCENCKKNKATWLYWQNRYSNVCKDCYYDIMDENIKALEKDNDDEVKAYEKYNYDLIKENLENDKNVLKELEDKKDIDNESFKYKNQRDKWGLPEIRTQTGHRVRSRGECLIANWLYENRITFEYERMVYVDGDENNFLISDFYLPDAKLYLEYWGYKDKGSYNLRRDQKEEIYKNKKFNLINIEDIHINSLDDFLRKSLLKYFKNL